VTEIEPTKALNFLFSKPIKEKAACARRDLRQLRGQLPGEEHIKRK
jgi:hypothetical protein